VALSQNQKQIPCYYLRAPNETVPPPQRDVLVLAGGGEHFFVGVHRQSHQQLTVTKHDLEREYRKNDSYLRSNCEMNKRDSAQISDNFYTDNIASNYCTIF
jgi:hypothetical protein